MKAEIAKQKIKYEALKCGTKIVCSTREILSEAKKTEIQQRVVKDTANEIYRKAEKKSYFKDGGHYDKDRYLLDMANLKKIVKGYGVEVE